MNCNVNLSAQATKLPILEAPTNGSIWRSCIQLPRDGTSKRSWELSTPGLYGPIHGVLATQQTRKTFFPFFILLFCYLFFCSMLFVRFVLCCFAFLSFLVFVWLSANPRTPWTSRIWWRLEDDQMFFEGCTLKTNQEPPPNTRCFLQKQNHLYTYTPMVLGLRTVKHCQKLKIEDWEQLQKTCQYDWTSAETSPRWELLQIGIWVIKSCRPWAWKTSSARLKRRRCRPTSAPGEQGKTMKSWRSCGHLQYNYV